MNRIAACVFAALLAALPAAAQETYPNRAITLVVPYAPGGGSDFLGRVLAEGLRARLNETVVVQNIAGAGWSQTPYSSTTSGTFRCASASASLRCSAALITEPVGL